MLPDETCVACDYILQSNRTCWTAQQ